MYVSDKVHEPGLGFFFFFFFTVNCSKASVPAGRYVSEFPLVVSTQDAVGQVCRWPPLK